jgi:hypothetical protein
MIAAVRLPNSTSNIRQPFAILISAKAVYKMKADPLSLSSSAVLILCLNLRRTYTFLNQRVRVRVTTAIKTYSRLG